MNMNQLDSKVMNDRVIAFSKSFVDDGFREELKEWCKQATENREHWGALLFQTFVPLLRSTQSKLDALALFGQLCRLLLTMGAEMDTMQQNALFSKEGDFFAQYEKELQDDNPQDTQTRQQ